MSAANLVRPDSSRLKRDHEKSDLTGLAIRYSVITKIMYNQTFIALTESC